MCFWRSKNEPEGLMLEIRRWNLWVWCCISLLEWQINRLIHRSFTQFNFKILDFTNRVKWGESGTRHGPRRNHELLMYYIQRRAFWQLVCSRFRETAQLSRPLLCGDSPKKKGHLAERAKLAFAVIALKIQKQPIISLADLIPTTKLYYKRKLRA